MKQVIRIIGGQFRGKKLSFPESAGLRPTPDRVRETLFNWLMHDIRNARCLDAFAGSGALGFEAFSRGASEVCFIEQNKVALAHLKGNISQFHTTQLTAIHDDACEYMARTTQPFDIIFLDPPFDTNLLETCLNELSQSRLLKAESLVYIESSHVVAINSTHWDVLKQKKAGQVFYGLLKRKGN